jgi:DNA-binding transcriptional LysR family regulator
MDKYQEMRVFTAVVDAGSFVAAAEGLGMSKAAVSRYVSDLEQRLGARLLHRTTRKLSLTAEGEVFLGRSREILESIEQSEAEISTRSHTASGLLKVSVPVSFGIRHLAPLWGDFVKAHPRVTLDVQLADRIMDLWTRASTSRCGSRDCRIPASSRASSPPPAWCCAPRRGT